MSNASDQTSHPLAPRCVALVGPQGTGKTTLLESMLFVTGAVTRKGSIKDGNTVGDGSEEARTRQMSTELSAAAATSFLGESWTILDCPGSVELMQETLNALMVVDAAIVVCEPDTQRVAALSPLLRFLDDNAIPHMLFVNKMDAAAVTVRDLMQALQAVSSRPLVLRQVPIREGESITGFIDLVSERAYRYSPGQPSGMIKLPDTMLEREKSARQEMLEHLADFDDALLEQLLEDVQPPPEQIYGQIVKDLAEDLIVPVLLGAGDRDYGVQRLMKALRHDVPGPERAAGRLSIPEGAVVAQVFKTVHAPHTGKLSYARIWRGTVTDGMSFGDQRVGGIVRLLGGNATKVPEAKAGEVVALGRMEGVGTGDILTPQGVRRSELWPAPLTPVFALAVAAENRNDEVKLTAAIAKLIEEDQSLSFRHDADLGEMQVYGQGEIHLQLALDRLRRKFNITVATRPPQVPYRETIRKGTPQHARFKRQSGGHGQFADIHIEIRPLARGEGFAFEEAIVGGAIPRQYIPGVEAGVRDFLDRGPLGFRVVDVAVKLTDGQFHPVDSSDMAFRTAGRMAMQEGMPKCDPVLLEPICEVSITVPSEYTSKAQRVLSSRRGQILGYDARPGWPGWDEVKAYLPQSEMQDLIIELRSLTLGLGSYTSKFSRLQELTGRLADQVIAARQAQVAAQ